jgi:hypothetical protein
MGDRGRHVAIGAIPIKLPEGKHEVTFSINDPGVVRSVAWCLEKRLIMARGEAQFDEVLTLFVEYAPTGPKRNRRFVVMATGEDLGVPEGFALSFVGSAISSNTGQVAHVFELKATTSQPQPGAPAGAN